MEISPASMNQTEALYGQAVSALRNGAPAEAAKLLRRAIKIVPELAILHDALGAALMAQGQAKQAVAHFKNASQLEPRLVSAWYNLGLAREASGQVLKAEAAYLRCLALGQDNAPANNNLGNIYRQQNQLEKAIACYQQALAVQPDLQQARANLAMAHSALAVRLHQQSDAQAALVHFKQAAERAPEQAGHHYNLGCAEAGLGHDRRAVTSLQRALEIDPGHADAHRNIGIALRGQGDLVAAIKHYRLAHELQPDRPDLLHHLASSLRRLGEVGESIELIERALAVDPDNFSLYSERGSAFKDQGRLAEAIVDLRKALTLSTQQAAIHSNLLLALNYADEVSSAELLAEHRRYARQFEAAARPTVSRDALGEKASGKLRIGYVSADLRQHSVSYFLEPVLQRHDHERFEIYAYYNHHRLDAVSQRLKSCCDAWREVADLPDEQLAELIAQDQIDILVDLGGHSGGNRLPVFGRRVAPVQVSWLGYPNTTGLTEMDYRITDEYTDPLDETGQDYSEELVRLPRHFSCYQPPADCPEVASTPVLAGKPITFGCFNNIAKLTPQALSTWGRILESAPDSRLLLKARALTDRQTVARIQAHFRAMGIDPGRIALKSRDHSKQHHLEHYAQVDIALDPFPYNGTTTTCEALWMGVPVIALKGQAHRGRVSASITASMGLEALVAESLDQYVAIAVGLAADPEHLQSLRTSMRERMLGSTLLDAAGFTAGLETAYEALRPGNQTVR